MLRSTAHFESLSGPWPRLGVSFLRGVPRRRVLAMYISFSFCVYLETEACTSCACANGDPHMWNGLPVSSRCKSASWRIWTVTARRRKGRDQERTFKSVASDENALPERSHKVNTFMHDHTELSGVDLFLVSLCVHTTGA